MRMRKRFFPFSMVSGLAAVLLLLNSCMGGGGVMGNVHLRKNIQVWSSPQLGRVRIRKIAVFPMNVTPIQVKGRPDSGVVCSFCGHPVREHRDFSHAAERLSLYLYEELKKRSTYEVVPFEKVFSTLRLEGGGNFYSDIPLDIALGKKLGVDAVVVGKLLRIRERVGGNYSVVSPASVSFRLKMIGVKDGREWFTVLFDETQKPLNEEPQRIFHPSRIRWKWWTADQLARSGIRDVVARFPDAANP